MAERSHVPEFGNWKRGENGPYTAFFDKARKGRTGGKMINPNDPEENPDQFSNTASPAQAPPSKTRSEQEESMGQGAFRPTREPQVSREDGHDNMIHAGSSAHQHHRGHGVKPDRETPGSVHSIDRSPLHPRFQGRTTGKGSRVSSPSWDGKSPHDSSHGTPGRSRLKPTLRSDGSLDKGAAVPKFGDWDENNPSSADGYTHIFNQVREERQAGGTKVSGMAYDPTYGNIQKSNAEGSDKCCCFPWGRK